MGYIFGLHWQARIKLFIIDVKVTDPSRPHKIFFPFFFVSSLSRASSSPNLEVLLLSYSARKADHPFIPVYYKLFLSFSLDILGMIPKLLLWTFLLSLMISLVSSNPAYTSRLNYGMVFEKQPQLYLAQETWFHTFEIDLPVDLNMIEISGCTHDHQTCLVVNQVLSEINKIRKNTKHTLDSALTTIEQLIPERAHMPKGRGKRALFGFIGQISKTAFGTATMDDVNLLARHINTLKNQESKLIKSVQQHENHLSSFIQASDERMSNLRSGIEQNHMAITHIHTQLQGSFQTLENSIITMNKIMARQIEQSQKWEWVLNELIAGIFSLVEGKLSPAIIPVNNMEQAVKGIKSILHNKYPGFHLNIPHPVDAYKTNKFVYTRNGSKLYIAVKFQMSPFQRPLSLYKILSYPVPINSTSNHATQLLNVPEYFAVTENKQYYATFSSAEFIACSKSFHWSCKFNKVLSPATHESCIMSIFQNDKALIKKHCDFRFLINHLFSQIIEISKSEILVYQSDLLEFDCKNGKRMIKGCNFCKLVVPCECSISTSQMYLSPRLASCHNKTQNITKLHPINLALLQQFFDTPTLSNMSGDSLFEDMPEIDVPQFQLYNHTMSNVLADDTKKHLSLKKMANKAKQDAVIFQSLTEPLLNGEIILDQGGLSTQDILLYATMLAVAACIFIIGFMALKLRKALIMLSVMQNVPTHVKASVVPSFRYIDTNTPAPTTEINILEQLQLSWDHAIFFITYCTLISVILMITYLICKSRSKKTTLMLELTCGDVCVMIPLKSLPLCPSYWSVQLPASIELVKVTGTFRPKLEIKWSDIKIQNKLNNKVFPVSSVYSINWFTANKINHMTKKVFDVYFYWSHDGLLEPINHFVNIN